MNLKDTGANNSVTFGENFTQVNSKLNVIGNENIVKVGKNCKISHCNLTIKGHGASITIADNVELNGVVLSIFTSCSFSVGAFTTMGNGRITVAEETRIDIGKDCMFAHDYLMLTSDMHPIYSLSNGERINFGRSIFVGDHVWTGVNVSILKGVEIDGNCVIGTQSLVNRSIKEKGVVVSGNPAKIIKRDVVWGRKMFNKTAMDDPRLTKYMNEDGIL